MDASKPALHDVRNSSQVATNLEESSDSEPELTEEMKQERHREVEKQIKKWKQGREYQLLSD